MRGEKAAESAAAENTEPENVSAEVDAASTDEPNSESASAEAETSSAEQLNESEQPTAESESVPAEPKQKLSREQLIDQLYRQWHTELAEKAENAGGGSGRNTGSIDLTHAHPTGAAQLYSHAPTRISLLVRERNAQNQAKRQLSVLKETVSAMAEKYGHAPVSLAQGAFTWTELPETKDPELWADSYDLTGELRLDPDMANTSVHQPVIDPHQPPAEATATPDAEIQEAKIVTVPGLFQQVRIKWRADGDADLQLSDKVDINPQFIQALRSNGGSPEVISELRHLNSQGTDSAQILPRLIALGQAHLPGFSYDSKAVLGCFARPEKTMLADLEAMEPYIRTSGVMVALAGDEDSRKLTSAPLLPGLVEDRDPAVERGAGDLDVGELDAVEAVASGRSIVLDCPPGAARYATLASICADAAASGRSVVVIPARASSGQTLRAELENINLGDLVADFSDVAAVPMRLRTGMRLAKPELDTDQTLRVREKLVEVRRELADFVEQLHQTHEDWGVSVHDLLEKLAALTADPTGPRTRVRFSKETLQQLSGGFDEVLGDLNQAAELGIFDSDVAISAWDGAEITDAEAGQDALEQAQRLVKVVPATVAQAYRAAGETGLRQAQTMAEWFEQVDVLDGISDSLDVFLPQIFETSPLNMAAATATRKWREAEGIKMSGGDRRRYRRQAQDLVLPGVAPSNLHEELLKADRRREVWARYTEQGGWPTLPDGMAQIRENRVAVESELQELAEKLGNRDLLNLPFDQLLNLLGGLISDADQLAELPERNAILATLREHGLADFVVDMQLHPESELAAELELSYYSSLFERLIASSPLLAKLTPRDIQDKLVELRELDRRHVETLSGPVLTAVINTARATMQARRADTLKMDQLLAKYSTGVLRDVIATYARLTQVARPVWIVPPTVTAEFIPPMPWADLVIVEATDSDSVAAMISPMMRGRQAVVVGDTRRRSAGNSEKLDVIGQFAQVLPVCELPTVRAMHAEMSARALMTHGYADVLDGIPSLPRRGETRLVQVDGRGIPPAGSDAVESTKTEVDAVVEEVINHAISRPDETLAVVTISPTHAQRVRESLRKAAEESTDIARLARKDSSEPLLVADISQVTGLRRDHTILSVGFGKTVHGRVLHSFGQLAEPAGLAGLIDAVESARNSLTVISALGPGEIDAERVSTPGPQLLAELIDRCAGSETTADSAAIGDEISPLLADLAKRLGDAGWQTCANYGYPGTFRIPLVAGHPDIPGTWAVAILVDNPEYVAQKSLRRRDRFRFAGLSERGWRVYQTYSTSLFIDPMGQADAVIALLEDALIAARPPAPIQVPEISEGDWGQELLNDISNEHAASGVMPALNEDGTLKGSTPEEDAADVAPTAADAAPAEPRERDMASRPQITSGLQLAAYTDDQLDDMLAWIASDNVPRSEPELVEELRTELDLQRRGVQIYAVLRNVVRRSGLAHQLDYSDDEPEPETDTAEDE